LPSVVTLNRPIPVIITGSLLGGIPIVDLELTPELEQTGIVERFAFYADTNAIHILLNHQYARKSIVVSVDKKDWNKTHNVFEKQLKQKGISKEHILQPSRKSQINMKLLTMERCIEIQ
jgi:hypothetical protein